ncbi:MAG TPA: hypothetical protein VD930_04505, partial [Gemmatimonadales bacterium]|nr:hypothetical protein [Gemmatimonadales bacterium]
MMSRDFLGVALAVLLSLGTSIYDDPERPGTSVLTSRPVMPVLAFPEPGIDDTASYQGYQTRFYRDSRGNTVQIYIQPQTSRVVLVWANGANESAGFNVRDARGRPAKLRWGAEAAQVVDAGQDRSIEYELVTDSRQIELGWFLLGSMRVERDFVYNRRYQERFSAPRFQVAEESLLVSTLAKLEPAERQQHLALLEAESVDQLRARLHPDIAQSPDSRAVVRLERPTLDGKNRMKVELLADHRTTTLRAGERTVKLSARNGPLRFRVRVTTDAAPLTPLTREDIFRPEFLEFLRRPAPAGDTAAKTRAHRLERQARGVELLSSKEKLMAGLPNFATYFGRDMMMTALMMRPIWTPAMSEHVIASVLRKLGPRGEVSHEEALGGQAIREHAVVYDSLIRANRNSQAREVLRDLQKTRENYHMIDDEFQLPVLAAEYLADTAVPAERKR